MKIFHRLNIYNQIFTAKYSQPNNYDYIFNQVFYIQKKIRNFANAKPQ
jgi:hypothetical protein